MKYSWGWICLILSVFHLKQDIDRYVFSLPKWIFIFTESRRYFTFKCTGNVYGNESFASRLQFYRLQCLILNNLFKTKGQILHWTLLLSLFWPVEVCYCVPKITLRMLQWAKGLQNICSSDVNVGAMMLRWLSENGSAAPKSSSFSSRFLTDLVYHTAKSLHADLI